MRKFLTALIIIIILNIYSSPQSFASLFEDSLNTLAKNNKLPESFIAVIDPEPQRLNPNKSVQSNESSTPVIVRFDSSSFNSLEELSQAFGLGIYQEDGVYAIAPPTTLNLAALISGNWTGDNYIAIEQMTAPLITSFTKEQLAELGSQNGLSSRKLNSEQSYMLNQILPPGAKLIELNIPNSEGARESIDYNYQQSEIFLKCSLQTQAIMLKSGNKDAVNSSWGFMIKNMDFGEFEKTFQISGSINELPMVPNYLKNSDLDYNRSELEIPEQINGSISLYDLIVRIAKDTGLKLKPCLGADKMKLYIRSQGLSAGTILKSIAFATQSTWRGIGSGYLLAADPIGISQAVIGISENQTKWDIYYDEAMYGQLNADWKASALSLLPFTNSEFIFTPQQIKTIMNWNVQGFGPLTKDMLTPEQIQCIEQKYAELKTNAQNKETKPLSYSHVMPNIEIHLSIIIPGLGIINNLPNLTINRSYEDDRRLDKLAPNGVSISIDKPVRGLMVKPAKSDTPKSIISIMTKHSFNTLYLKVFTDGYTIYPSSIFPQSKTIEDTDYLTNIINIAHENNIKVNAVVDVLRWSDGDKNHWVRNNPELLDRDILGRTQSEWDISGFRSNTFARVEHFLMGDARKGDVVTPLNPAVREKLLGLIQELSAYKFDGLVLDHTAVRHTNMGTIVHSDIGARYSPSDMMPQTGQPGFNDISRAAYVGRCGIDPIDLSLEDASPSSYIPNEKFTPVIKVVEAAEISGGYLKIWNDYYIKSCDDLLDSIISMWQKNKKDIPVWVADTYSEDLDMSHDWKRFTGRISGLLNTLAMDSSTYPGHGMNRIAVLRASDSIGSLIFADMLARMQNKLFPGMLGPMEVGRKLYAGQGIVIDLACSERNRREFLRIIKPTDSKK